MDEGNSRLKPFPTTQWSLIVRAASDDSIERQRALGEICCRYWPPVYAFIRSRGHAPHDAEDLTQGLFARLLMRNDFAKVDADYGSLRNYLLTASKNYLNMEYRREHSLKRGGSTEWLSCDAVDAEGRCLIPEPMDEISPEKVFDRQWAITIMEEVAAALEAQYAEKDHTALFTALKPFITADDGTAPQKPLAAQLGMTDAAFRVAVHRLRQRYAKLLRQTVSATLGPEGSVEDEIAQLMASFW